VNDLIESLEFLLEKSLEKRLRKEIKDLLKKRNKAGTNT